MNIIGLVVSAAVFVFNLRLFYEIWFLPEKFMARGQDYRNWLRNFLGFSYWREGRVNLPLVKFANILLLFISAVGIIVSITGPISY